MMYVKFSAKYLAYSKYSKVAIIITVTIVVITIVMMYWSYVTTFFFPCLLHQKYLSWQCQLLLWKHSND